MNQLIKKMHNKFEFMEDREYIEKFLVYNLSLVIAKEKTSATITFKKSINNIYKHWLKYGVEFIAEIGLCFINLVEEKEVIIVLVYDKNLLEKYIFKEENYKFLLKVGYPKEKIFWEYLKFLKERYSFGNCPDELGIFLGFPINDVNVFMNDRGKECLMYGYWKVYSDYDKAKDTFNRYNLIKDFALKSILNDYTSKEIILNLSNICV